MSQQQVTAAAFFQQSGELWVTVQAAQRAVDAIERMCRDLAIPEHLAQVGAKPEMLEDFAISCEKAGYNRWNPRHTSKDDFLKLFEAAL